MWGCRKKILIEYRNICDSRQRNVLEPILKIETIVFNVMGKKKTQRPVNSNLN